MSPDEVTDAHRARKAYVYVRQSTQKQVLANRESQRRQRELVKRPVKLGWAPDLVHVIDEDLGQSGSRAQVRSGFEGMVADVALGHVGMVVALEVARFARGNRNWYHLLDVCAVTRTLIADNEGLYDPRQHNDRLVLGLKGTMSEAELHLIRQRLVEATLSRARRGEFRVVLAPGYVWDEAGRIQKHPDERVRSVIALIFERFAKLSSMHAVQRSLVKDGISVPVRRAKGRLEWIVPSYDYVSRVLTGPLYAGAYSFGRRQVEEVLDEQHQPRKRVRPRAREDWHTLIRDHHDPYISWEVFEANQEQIARNYPKPGPGPVRGGRALLQGLVLCGRCGRRMSSVYAGKRLTVRYVCNQRDKQLGSGTCQSFGAYELEKTVQRLVLECLQPLGVEAMLEAARAHAQTSDVERAHWKQKVEQAEYEVDLAFRQYSAVDPANRLVARELERRWEASLRALEEAKSEAASRTAHLDPFLSQEEERELRRYAEDLCALWEAPTTRAQDRKRIVRCLVESVVALADGPRMLSSIHWVGGEVSDFECSRLGGNSRRSDPELVEFVRDAARHLPDDQIARVLQRRRIRSAHGHSFTSHRVACLRGRYDIAPGPGFPSSGEDVYTAQEAARLLGVTVGTVHCWVKEGLLCGAQKSRKSPWQIRVTKEDRRRLTTGDAPEGWLSLAAAAEALGVTEQTVLDRLKAGQLEGVRVRVARRFGWRIRVESGPSDDSATLFD